MNQFASRINESRLKKGISQEQLAQLTGLNLRTIQRIEKGDTVPRGDSLQKLSRALGTSPDELVDWTIKEDKSLISMLNLSQLTFLIFPLLGVLIPMAIWILQKDKINKVDYNGKSILNFQITWSIVFFIFSAPTLYAGIALWPANVFLFVTVFIYGFNITIILLNTFLIAKNKKVFYKPSINILSL